MTRAAVWIAAVLLAGGSSMGCVSTEMKAYVGRDILDVVVDNGPPVHVFDMGDGRRAFQWRWGGGTFTTPVVESGTSTVTAIGSSAWLTSTKIQSGGQTIVSEGCIITYFARWDQEREKWVIVDYSYPKRLVC